MLGKKSTGPEPNPSPRRERTLNHWQDRFVLAILAGWGRSRRYGMLGMRLRRTTRRGTLLRDS